MTSLHRSLWLVVILTVVALVGLAVTQWLTAQASLTATAVVERRTAGELESLARSFGRAEQVALEATVPTEPALAHVYASFEALAARHGAVLSYNFAANPEQDPSLVQAEAARDSWVIPIDFLGERSALETIFHELETGPYLVKIHRYRFDVTDPAESLLSTTLILSGQ